MSKFEIKKQESFTITKKGDSSIYVSLSPSEAEDLYQELHKLLKKDKDRNTLWEVGDSIPAGSREPDLPTGSRIKDDSTYEDVAERTEDGWNWITLLGQQNRTHGEWKWYQWQEQSWTVTRVGK